MTTEELKALSEMSETELREFKAPWPETIENLNDVIHALVERKHDYGTCVYAMSIAAVAAYNFVAGKLGVTGFQASCADLDIIRRNRLLKGPLGIVNGENMLYPQYDILGTVSGWLEEWRGWAAEEAKKKLADVSIYVHPDVVAHWKMLAAVDESGPTVPNRPEGEE